MRGETSRRAFLAGLGASWITAPAWAESALAPSTSLRPVLRGSDFHKRQLGTPETLVDRSRLSGVVSFAVADAKTGAILESHNGGRALPPASVAKAITASYALVHLGPDHRFTTSVLATGTVSGGVVSGDLILAGGGDPTLDTDGLAELAAMLKDKGITAVKGRFLVYGGALPRLTSIDGGQPDHVGYNPAISGLNLNFNRVHFEWKRAQGDYTVTMDARSEKYRPAVRIARMGVISRKAPVYTYSDSNGRDNWTVASAALGKGGARWLPVRRPELYAGEVFQTFARSHGIFLQAPRETDSLPAHSVIAQRQSAPLRVILRDMLRYSTNLTAEVVGLAATIKSGSRPATLEQSADAMTRWAKQRYNLANVRFVDHSGLGDASRIASADMVRALVGIRGHLGLEPLLKSMPMRDNKRKVIKNHPVSVRAKTGTLNFVSGLAGYMTANDGRELVFAIFSANTRRRDSLTKAQRERPDGGRTWNNRARSLQQDLIDRWDVLYGA